MILHTVLFYVMNILAGIVSSVLFALLSKETAYVLSESVFMIVYLLAFLIPAWLLHKIICKRQGVCTSPIFCRGKRLGILTPLLVMSAITINFSAAIFNHELVTAVIPIPKDAVLYPVEPMTQWYQLLIMLLSTAVIPAVCEEILFRGVILNHLIPYGRGMAILSSSLLFGLMHSNVSQFFYTTLLGVVIGYLYVRTKSIWLCMLIHFVNNGISVLEEGLFNLSDPDLAQRLYGLVELLVLILGGLSILLLILYHRRRKPPEEDGCFRKTEEPSMEYEEVAVTKEKKISLFCTPSMIVFFVLSGLSMISTALALLMTWGTV